MTNSELQDRIETWLRNYDLFQNPGLSGMHPHWARALLPLVIRLQAEAGPQLSATPAGLQLAGAAEHAARGMEQVAETAAVQVAQALRACLQQLGPRGPSVGSVLPLGAVNDFGAIAALATKRSARREFWAGD